MFKIVQSGNNICVYTPYNKDFVQTMRNLKGTWTGEAWQVDADLIESVRANMMECYGRTDLPVKLYNIKITVHKQISSEYRQGLYMFGRCVCFAFGRDSGAKIADGINFLSGGCDSDGSAKNWYTIIAENSQFLMRDIPEDALKIENPYTEFISVEILPKVDIKAELLKEKEILLSRLTEINKQLEGLE